jgi:L-threonylcarbamoyladenylate synthase
MEIIKINPNRIEKKKIDYVVKSLKKGKVVVLPTDTSYGLAAKALDKNAVERLYGIKKRPKKSPLTIFVRNFSQISKFAEISERTKKLFNKFLPGPLSLIVPKKNNLFPKLIISKNDIGFRIPDNKIIIKILKKIDFPITATSANVSGDKEPYSIEEILKQYKNKTLKPDLVIDVGRLKKTKPSTIVDLSGDKMKLIRKGPIEYKDIINTLKSL